MRFISSAAIVLMGTVAQASTGNPVENRYQTLTQTAFEQLDESTAEYGLPNASIEKIIRQVRKARRNNQLLRAAAYVLANRGTIADNFSNDDVPFLVETLLDSHLITLATQFVDSAPRYGSSYTLARIRLVLAQYHAGLGDWQGAEAHLREIDIANVLATEEANRAYITYGAALQGLDQHRKSVDYYERVPPTSDHYPIAQLNTAVAFIRQGWWSDARLAIESALESHSSSPNAMTDRLHTVLGFSQIQYEFYRDARENFRHVRTNSPYASRALLGLGIAALHQEDFVGGLNAFDHLKRRKNTDISKIESYLLAAFTLQQMAQNRDASAAYNEAMAFYQQYIGRCDVLIKRIHQHNKAPGNSESITQDELFDQVFNLTNKGRQDALRRLMSKIDLVSQLRETDLPPQTLEELSNLRQQLKHKLLEQSVQAVTERRDVVDSYLSQARFGLAQLHDEN